MLMQIWMLGILRPDQDLKLFVSFLWLFLDSFCDVAAHIGPLGDHCHCGAVVSWGFGVVDLQEQSHMNVRIQGFPAECGLSSQSGFNVVADGCIVFPVLHF